MTRYFSGMSILFSTAFSPMYLLYAFLWAWGIESLVFLTLGESQWSFGSESIVRGFSVYLSLFFLTLIDEIKDYQYDKEYNPDRVLVTGALKHKDLILTATGIVFVLLTLNFFMFPNAAFIIVADIIYACLLLLAESKSQRFKESVIINLIFTYPVQFLLSIYLVLSVVEQQELLSSSFTPQVWLWPIAMMCAYLHYEMGRKTTWDTSNAKFYSSVLGSKTSGITVLTFGLLGIAISSYMLIFVIQAWSSIISSTLVIAQITLVIIGFIRFISQSKSWPQAFALGFFFLFLFSSPIHVLSTAGAVW
ncbi:hypothetical protein KIH87_12330 [Paraneptunicella aestuarii]|uniref:hypothetical protein n=1 Tax=Paraneptunicella aestuarii TaxID=2831148 RepID=UPI001E54FC7D|nr:hypothetical protein [Paraneptunicella aestuarii]UAA37499.1 hypothetical protein KIH87_12330 [Paraneptunicella aestuarii]